MTDPRAVAILEHYFKALFSAAGLEWTAANTADMVALAEALSSPQALACAPIQPARRVAPAAPLHKPAAPPAEPIEKPAPDPFAPGWAQREIGQSVAMTMRKQEPLQ